MLCCALPLPCLYRRHDAACFCLLCTACCAVLCCAARVFRGHADWVEGLAVAGGGSADLFDQGFYSFSADGHVCSWELDAEQNCDVYRLVVRASWRLRACMCAAPDVLNAAQHGCVCVCTRPLLTCMCVACVACAQEDAPVARCNVLCLLQLPTQRAVACGCEDGAIRLHDPHAPPAAAADGCQLPSLLTGHSGKVRLHCGLAAAAAGCRPASASTYCSSSRCQHA